MPINLKSLFVKNKPNRPYSISPSHDLKIQPIALQGKERPS